MFNFLKKRNAQVTGNVVEVVEPKFGLQTLYENTTLFLNNGAIVSPDAIEVNRSHTNIEFGGQMYNSVDVLQTNVADIFGHKLDIMTLEVFRTYFDSRFCNNIWYGAKEKDGVQTPITNISWNGPLVAGTQVHFSANGVFYRTEVYEIEFASNDFVVFTTNAAGTKRYFIFK